MFGELDVAYRLFPICPCRRLVHTDIVKQFKKHRDQSSITSYPQNNAVAYQRTLFFYTGPRDREWAAHGQAK